MALVLSWNCWMKNRIVIGMGHEGIFRLNWGKCWSTGPKMSHVPWCTVSGVASFPLSHHVPLQGVQLLHSNLPVGISSQSSGSETLLLPVSWLQSWPCLCHSVLTSGPDQLLYQLHLDSGLVTLWETEFCSVIPASYTRTMLQFQICEYSVLADI